MYYLRQLLSPDTRVKYLAAEIIWLAKPEIFTIQPHVDTRHAAESCLKNLTGSHSLHCKHS